MLLWTIKQFDFRLNLLTINWGRENKLSLTSPGSRAIKLHITFDLILTFSLHFE